MKHDYTHDDDATRYFVGIDELKREVQKEHDHMVGWLVICSAAGFVIGYIFGVV